jgi:hypothetical protein
MCICGKRYCRQQQFAPVIILSANITPHHHCTMSSCLLFTMSSEAPHLPDELPPIGGWSVPSLCSLSLLYDDSQDDVKAWKSHHFLSTHIRGMIFQRASTRPDIYAHPFMPILGYLGTEAYIRESHGVT